MDTTSRRFIPSLKGLLLALMILVLLTFQAGATEQMHDEIIYNGLMGELETDWAYPSPLEQYFKGGYPFQMLSTANYRGHIATWEIRDEKLYLIGIRIPIRDNDVVSVPLEWLFTGPNVAKRVHAQWFTGMLLTFIDPYKEWHKSNTYPGEFYVIRYKRIVIVDVKNGDVIETTEFTDEEYRTREKQTVAQKAALQSYNKYVKSFDSQPDDVSYQPFETDRPDIPVEKLLDMLVYRPWSRRDDQSELMAWSMCQQLAGWQELRRIFDVDDAMVGFINQFPKSLHVDLTTTHTGLINSIWWWNPLIGDQPQYTWLQLLEVYNEANRVVANHAWLHEWRDASPARSLQLHAFGLGIGEVEEDLQESILPVWRQSGLKGQPDFSFYARNGAGWARMLFSKDDPRALVMYVSQPFNLFGSAEEQPPAFHWLDNLPVGYNSPRCTPGAKSAQYAVVEPNGKWEIRSFSGCVKR